jgi:oligopeptide/dipeptide ABC transporter ATP-binding protein
MGLSYLFISHDLNVVGYLCNTISVMYNGSIMESAPSEDIFNHPHHPYTISLLSAVPAPDKKWDAKLSHEQRDDSDAVSESCEYQKKCLRVETQCRSNKIDFVKVGENHFVRCWKTDKNK